MSAKENSALVFAKNFFKNPRMLGSLIPSSRFLIAQLLRDVDWQKARVIVEIGPGVGTISAEMLKRMRPDATLVTLEINEDFVRHLRTSFDDPRLRVIHRSGADIREVLRELNLPQADYVVAGIPFSILTDELRMAVLRNCYDALVTGGTMLVYQFSSKVRGDLEKLYRNIDRGYELRNVLPAHVFRCRKS
ncbi:MAG: methyltransferase domain-containing protein [Acidobacteriota bacterium]|nr:methyltransferase domain-containing protein [Acidobacteriota bacterium]